MTNHQHVLEEELHLQFHQCHGHGPYSFCAGLRRHVIVSLGQMQILKKKLI